MDKNDVEHISSTKFLSKLPEKISYLVNYVINTLIEITPQTIILHLIMVKVNLYGYQIQSYNVTYGNTKLISTRK